MYWITLKYKKPQNKKHQRSYNEPKKNKDGLRMEKITMDCKWRSWKI